MRYLMFLSITFLNALAVHAQQEDPIDADLSRCMENDPSTYGVLECYAQAEKRWDEELNKVYKDLMARLDDNGRSALKTSQISWLKYRDNEFTAINGVYALVQGTMYQTMAAGDRLKIIRDRVHQLRSYQSTLTIDK